MDFYIKNEDPHQKTDLQKNPNDNETILYKKHPNPFITIYTLIKLIQKK